MQNSYDWDIRLLFLFFFLDKRMLSLIMDIQRAPEVKARPSLNSGKNLLPPVNL